MPPKDIPTVFLDAGGVLVWPNWRRVADALREHGVDVAAEALAAADAPARATMDKADLIAASSDQRRGFTYFDLVLTKAGVAITERTDAALEAVQQYHRVENLWEHVPTFVPPTLRTLRARGYRLVVVSNANGTVARLLARVGIAPLVDVIIDSAVEGFEKPDRRLFEIALERAGASPSHTVHVGDFYHIDVAGARGAGLRAVLVDEANLYPNADCPRVRSVSELPALLREVLPITP